MATIRINGDTSGYVQLSAPAVAGNTNLTLPLTGFGKVLQVVQTTYNTQQTNNTNTFADTGLSATITPTLTTSKVLVLVSQAGCGKLSGNTQSSVQLKLFRGTTEILWISSNAGYTNSSADMIVGTQNAVYLDSPATTSATTYKTQFANRINAAGCRVQWNNAEETSTMTLIEIGP